MDPGRRLERTHAHSNPNVSSLYSGVCGGVFGVSGVFRGGFFGVHCNDCNAVGGDVGGAGGGGGVDDVFLCFHEWLERRGYAESYRKCLVRCVKRVLAGDSSFLNGKSQNWLASGSAFAKFLGVYDQWRAFLRSHGVTWKRRGSGYFFGLLYDRRRLVEEVLDWMQKCREAQLGEDVWFALAFLGCTGVRTGEGGSKDNPN